jgi:sugar (pentulose or hexulose) kinase
LLSAAGRWAAACIYLALMTRTCLDLIGAHGSVLVEGPFAGNNVFVRALAALVGRDVVALPGSTGTSQGAALLAGVHPISSREMCIAPLDVEGLQTYADIWHGLVSQSGSPMQIRDADRSRVFPPPR